MADFQQGRQVVVDRLKRRLSNYRHNHNSVTNRYDNCFDQLNNDQQKQTILLKQRHIESKAKKANKKTTEHKKQDNSSLLATMGVSDNTGHLFVLYAIFILSFKWADVMNTVYLCKLLHITLLQTGRVLLHINVNFFSLLHLTVHCLSYVLANPSLPK